MEQEYSKILVGVDGSTQAMDAFKKAIEVARRNRGTVYVANVIDPQVYDFMGLSTLDQSVIDQETASSKQLIKECKDYAKLVDFDQIEGIIAYGSAKEAMAKKIPEEYGIDLIMVGQSGQNAVERVMIGSVAGFVIRNAPCDVLIVTDKKD